MAPDLPFITPEWIAEVGSQPETPLIHVETTAQRNQHEVLLSGRSSCIVCTYTGLRGDENLERSAVLGGRISVAALILHGLQQHKCNTVPSVRGLIGSHWPGIKVSAELHLHSFLEALEDFHCLVFFQLQKASALLGLWPSSSIFEASRIASL